ncbi:MAG: HAMP domain-containing histidine kinase [Cryobacterium sp.]|nr:HAMP domain-containing histidine kinase [Cryobacterium sp.]
MTGSQRPIVDSDTLAIRRASRLVGTRIAVACAAVVAVVIVAVFVYILSEISPGELFEPVPDTNNLRVSAVKLLRAAAVLGVALIVLAGLLSWWVTRRAVQPLGEVLRIQRAFIADASHELRTPLAVLDARLQILQRTLPEGDPSAPLVAELRSDTKDLVHVFNDLLESAEIGGAAVIPTSSTDVNAAIAAAVGSMALIAVDKQVSIEFVPTQSASAPLPASSVTRCMVALLDNAVRVAPTGSVIFVEATVAARSLAVTVRDCGPGIVGIDPARIFDRFAHSSTAVDGAGDARTGFGIGLSLVREIAVRYGGAVTVVESSPAGTAIRLSLPRTK